MKKPIFGMMLIVILTMFLLSSCTSTPNTENISMTTSHKAILEGYDSCDEHWDDGFRDYTDYCVYYYNENYDDAFANSEYYSELTENDIAELLVFLEDFEGWVACFEGYEEWYGFIPNEQVEAGDYFKLDKKSSVANNKFENYDIYYYDVDQHILYFFHSNT